MSIKTLRKRIALVAVSTLGAGLLSVIAVPSAFAAAGDLSLAANGGTSTSSRGIVTIGGSSSTTSISNSVSLTETATILANGQAYLTIEAGGTTSGFAVSGGTIVSCVANTQSGVTVGSGSTTCTTSNNEDLRVMIEPNAGATTMVATSYTEAARTTAKARITFTVSAVTSNGSFSAANSKIALWDAALSSPLLTNSDSPTGFRVANGSQGYINMTLKDANGAEMPSTTAVGCSATGGAVCSFTSATFLGAAAAATYGSSGVTTVFVGQGTANTAIATTVTITVNGATYASKSLALLGPLAKLEIGTSDAASGGIYGKVSTSDGYIGVKATDSLGRVLTSQSVSFTAASYNASVTAYSISSTDASETSDNTDSTFTCSAIAGTAKAQVFAVNAKNETITSNEFTVNCVGGAFSYTAALDKAVYVPGDIATLTITLKDSGGRPAADSSDLGTTNKPVAIAGSNMTAVTAPSNVDSPSAGVKKYTFIVGATEGSYQLSVSLPAIDTAVTVPYTIKASTTTVSNTEVLAAIVKLIASINKQIRALQKSLRR